MPETYDTLLRLVAAAVCGMVIGLNRDINGKPMGMRTLGLVSLACALASVAAVHYANLDQFPDALSRVVQGVLQGVLAGIGFIGAGVILRNPAAGDVQGLTTAATVWVAAALGVACAFAAWHLVLAGLTIALVILIAMKPVERFLVRLLGGEPPEDRERSAETKG